MNQIETLTWDSHFFGYSVAKIDANQLDLNALSRLVETAKSCSVRLIYLFINSFDKTSEACALLPAAELVDKKITYFIRLKSVNLFARDECISIFNKPYPSNTLIALSLQSGVYSRFKIDPNFINNEYQKMYTIWIERAVAEVSENRVFVYTRDEIELGFIALRILGGTAKITLMAVDESSRGNSIGAKLMFAVFDYLAKQNIFNVEVVTQVRNLAACGFYEKMGFREKSVQSIYHIWCQKN